MLVDSLILTALMGFLPSVEIPVTPSLQGIDLDSATVTVTIEITGTLAFETIPAKPPILPTLPLQTNLSRKSQSYVITAVDRVAAYASAWQVPDLCKEVLGYLSVSESAGLADWNFRTTITKSLFTSREERIQWSLVHGVF